MLIGLLSSTTQWQEVFTSNVPFVKNVRKEIKLQNVMTWRTDKYSRVCQLLAVLLFNIYCPSEYQQYGTMSWPVPKIWFYTKYLLFWLWKYLKVCTWISISDDILVHILNKMELFLIQVIPYYIPGKTCIMIIQLFIL